MDKEDIVKSYIKEARKYVGTPFKHQGRDKNGLDCIGIIVVPLREIQFFNYENKNYKRYGLGGEIKEVLLKYCYELSWPCPLERGDILLFTKENSQHLAIYTGYSIIHANNFVGKVVEHILDDKWKSLINKVYRYKEEV